MEVARDQSKSFSRDAFTRANVEITTLKANLPKEAVRALAQEVVSRLANRATEVRGPGAEPDARAIDRLCTALVSEDVEAAARFVSQLRSDGASMETVLLSYLAASARRLGEWWDDDRVSFTDVTIGASRIYAIMRGLRHVLAPVQGGVHASAQNHAVFASVPDEIHTLGVTMAADLFRKHGWRIDLKVGLTHDDLVEALRHSECPVIGLSASGPRSLVALARLIVAVRINNPGSLILVSGQIVNDERDRVGFLGADGIAWDVPSALSEMQRLAGLAVAGRH